MPSICTAGGRRLLAAARVIAGLSFFILNASSASAVSRDTALDPEIRALYQQASDAFFKRREREEGLRLFQQAADLAEQKRNHYWHGLAIFGQAQIFGWGGDSEAAAATFERALEVSERDPEFIGSANHLILLGNLYGEYESLGRRAEALRVHRLAIAGGKVHLKRLAGFPADCDLFELTDDDFSLIKTMAFISAVYASEMRVRFEAGDDAGARALAEKIDGRLDGTGQPREVTRYARILETLAELHRVAGRETDEEAVLLRLIDLGKVPKTEAWDEIMTAQSDLALLRARRGADFAAQMTLAQTALDGARRFPSVDLRLYVAERVARLHEFGGEHDQALALIDATIDDARRLNIPLLLAKLLLTRAEFKLDQGRWADVQADLFEALKWFRRQGGLRAETAAHVLYARYLRLASRSDEARRAYAQADASLRRFPDARLSRMLEREATLIAALPPSVASNSSAAPSDLQPVELTTRVAPGWSARGRFTITNPGSAVETGVISAKGRALKAEWDEGALLWRVAVADGAGPVSSEVSQTVTLRPLDQATVVLNVPHERAAEGEIQLAWRGRAPGAAFWRYSQDEVDSDLAVIDANLALENPFYSVPLHHYLVRNAVDAGAVVNVRVTTSAPCRIELVEPVGGRVLAVDAEGDGSFRGTGDVIFSDSDQDGVPDLRFDAARRDAELEIQVYPAGAYDEVEVRLETRKPDGSWSLGSVDRLLGQR